jgi:hypothetical protein
LPDGEDIGDVSDQEADASDKKANLFDMAKKRQNQATTAEGGSHHQWDQVDPAQSLHFAAHPQMTVFGSTAASALMRDDREETDDDANNPSDSDVDSAHRDDHNANVHPLLSGTVLSAEGSSSSRGSSPGAALKAATSATATTGTTPSKSMHSTREYSSDVFEASSSTDDEREDRSATEAGVSSVVHPHDASDDDNDESVAEEPGDGEEVEFIRPGTVGWRVGDECGTSINSLTANRHQHRVGGRVNDQEESEMMDEASSPPAASHRHYQHHHAESDSESIADETGDAYSIADEGGAMGLGEVEEGAADPHHHGDDDQGNKYDGASFASTQTATYDDEASIRAQMALIQSEGVRACGGDAVCFTRVLDAVRSGVGRECPALAPLSDAAAADALYCAFRYVMLASSVGGSP